MKKLIVLISSLFLSSTVFSQTDTTTNTKSFPIPVVRQIMKDLLSGDSAKAQLKLTEQQLLETERKVELKDSIIISLREKEANLGLIINSEKEKFKIVEDYSKKLEWSLKKEKVKNKFKSFVGAGIIAALTFFVINK